MSSDQADQPDDEESPWGNQHGAWYGSIDGWRGRMQSQERQEEWEGKVGEGRGKQTIRQQRGR